MSKQVKNPWSHWCFLLVNNVRVLLATHGFLQKSKFWMLERIVFLLLKITEGVWTGNMELSAAQVPLNSGTIIWMHLVENLAWSSSVVLGGEEFITWTFNMPPTIFNKKACAPLLCGSNDDTVLTKAMVDHVYPPVLNMVGTKIRL